MRLLLLILPLFALILNIFGLMRLIPLYFTIPLLFASIYMTVYFFYDKKQFKGFRKVTH
ncbi:hypothetical protein JCM21714_3434 [Gracilibacillus boraciitolerans JCM 21714]|uniref:Uncharacterized protein n=1 Tax=Gracilibacillus boraciitolerans JCM 21714 TaxID=1298598 RepID=W4VLN5_9BACI|nr:hypothetical protein [Gracilibacillus boraciitolerans]GAE94290.1 hypothetical protein JCM21714_3434 [Gracilibacillus boraciitolerans JCM 21714]